MTAGVDFIPARHFHEGRLSGVDVLVLHTSESASTAAALGRYFATTDREASAHSGVDDLGRRVDYVHFDDTAWAAPGANADGEQLELCGLARWDRATWLGEHRLMLDAAVGWLVERCHARRIPPVILTANDLLNNKRGITTHYAVSQAFHKSTHTDPGIGLPLDYLIRRVTDRLEAPASLPSRIPPAFPFGAGHYLGTARASRFCHSGVLGGADRRAVLVWQRRMRQRGFHLTLDGIYNAADRDACLQLQRHRPELRDDGLVGPATWRATWTLPAG